MALEGQGFTRASPGGLRAGPSGPSIFLFFIFKVEHLLKLDPSIIYMYFICYKVIYPFKYKYIITILFVVDKDYICVHEAGKEIHDILTHESEPTIQNE